MKIKQLLENGEQFWPVVGPDAIIFQDEESLSDKLDTLSGEVSSLSGVFASVEYDTNNKALKFYDSQNSLVTSLNVTAFVKDGMLDAINVSDNNLVFTFNPESGKNAVSIPISSIFNSDNYYTKQDIDQITEVLANIETITDDDVRDIINTIFE